jgi:dynein heavy chain
LEHGIANKLIQVHLLKLFDNVKDFTFARGNKIVTALASSEGEGFSLRTHAPVDGPVETWMTGAETEMRASLRAITKEGVFKYASTPRLRWVEEHLGMVAVVGSQIWWYDTQEHKWKFVTTGRLAGRGKRRIRSVECELAISTQ